MRFRYDKTKSEKLQKNPNRGIGFEEAQEIFAHPYYLDKRSAESIARMADHGEDVSGFFTNRGKMMQPIQRVNVDFTAAMLQELDHTAAELNVSRQAVIKTFIRQALDRHYLAQKARKARRG
jgi:uncharacterized DUF497 family protein